jgi:hypothetical protein
VLQRTHGSPLELHDLDGLLKAHKPIERELHVIFHPNENRLLGFRVAGPCADRVVDDGDRVKLQTKLPRVELRHGAGGRKIIHPSERGVNRIQELQQRFEPRQSETVCARAVPWAGVRARGA